MECPTLIRSNTQGSVQAIWPPIERMKGEAEPARSVEYVPGRHGRHSPARATAPRSGGVRDSLHARPSYSRQMMRNDAPDNAAMLPSLNLWRARRESVFGGLVRGHSHGEQGEIPCAAQTQETAILWTGRTFAGSVLVGPLIASTTEACSVHSQYQERGHR